MFFFFPLLFPFDTTFANQAFPNPNPTTAYTGQFLASSNSPNASNSFPMSSEASTPGVSSLSGSTFSTGKSTTIILPGDKKPKIIGCGKKSEIKADVDVLKSIHRNRDELNSILDLSKNNITVIPTALKELAHLQELYLYTNRLQTLPSEIGQLANLRVLALYENSLTSLPEALSHLKSLEFLDIRHNKLTEIPDFVYSLTSLSTLYLRFNRIREVCSL